MPRSWYRILSSPATLLVAAMVFALSVLCLLVLYPHDSDVVRTLHNGFRPARTSQSGYYDNTWFSFQNGVFRPIPDDQRSSLAGIDPSCRLASLKMPYRSFGFWSPTSRWGGVQVVVEPTGLTPAEIALFRRTYVDYLTARDEWLKPHAATLYTTDTLRTVPVWSGWIHNAISLLSFLIMIVSFPLVALHLLRERRINKGLCPHCRYDRTGLEAATPCPECGEITPA